MNDIVARIFAVTICVAGIALFIRPRWLLEFWVGPRLFDSAKWDCLHPLLRSRLRAALERRRVESAQWPSYVGGTVQIFIGAAALLWNLSVPMIFAVWATGTAPVLAVAMMRAGPSSRSRRVASLEPRRPLGGIPMIISTAALAALAITAIIAGSRESLAIGLAAVVCGASALYLASAPAVLTGEDLAAERYVDKMVRTVQACSIALFGLTAAPLMMSSHTSPEWAKAVALAAYFAGFCAFGFAYRLPDERERTELAQ